MDTRAIIVQQMTEVAAEQSRTLAPLTDDLVLLDSGLDSLSFAILVARLEDVLGFDPFAEAEDFHFPVTLADFVAFYSRTPSDQAVAV
jgi:acyl carrier protein